MIIQGHHLILIIHNHMQIDHQIKTGNNRLNQGNQHTINSKEKHEDQTKNEVGDHDLEEISGQGVLFMSVFVSKEDHGGENEQGGQTSTQNDVIVELAQVERYYVGLAIRKSGQNYVINGTFSHDRSEN